MFVPDKITHFLDKATLIAGLGFVIAACAIIMLKNSIELLINGDPQQTLPRVKSLCTMIIAIALLTTGITIILESDAVLAALSIYFKAAIKPLLYI